MRDISHIPENQLSSLKTKFGNACKKLSNVLVPYKYLKKTFSEELSRNKDLCILKQDKGCSVVLIDRTNYTSKFKQTCTNVLILF